MDDGGKLVRRRAKTIFERENADKNVVWGEETRDGQPALAFQERVNPNAPTITIVGAEMRERYMERARQELKDEGRL